MLKVPLKDVFPGAPPVPEPLLPAAALVPAVPLLPLALSGDDDDAPHPRSETRSTGNTNEQRRERKQSISHLSLAGSSEHHDELQLAMRRSANPWQISAFWQRRFSTSGQCRYDGNFYKSRKSPTAGSQGGGERHNLGVHVDVWPNRLESAHEWRAYVRGGDLSGERQRRQRSLSGGRFMPETPGQH